MKTLAGIFGFIAGIFGFFAFIFLVAWLYCLGILGLVGGLLLLAAAGDVEVEAERGEEALVAQRVGVELAREADFEVARADVALLHEAQRDAPGGAGTRAEQHPVGGQLRAGGLRFGPEGRIGIHAKCDFFGHGRQDFVLPLHRGQ